MASSDNSRSTRPRVLNLGGGFAGVGAAQQVKDADARSCWSTATTTTPSSRHLALLPTNEDRAKAVVDWAVAAVTRERVGRFSVESA